MRLHTGETQYQVTQAWTWPQREKLGQELLRHLAEAIINHWDTRDLKFESDAHTLLSRCKKSLELDGFIFKGTVLLIPEEDVLDAKEEAGVLQHLYKDLQLEDSET